MKVRTQKTIDELKAKLTDKIVQVVLNLPIKGDGHGQIGYKTLGDFIKHVETYHEAINLLNHSIVEEFQQVNAVLDVLVKLSKTPSTVSTVLPSIHKTSKNGTN